MLEIHHPNPAVLSILYGYATPAVVFIHWVFLIVIGHERQVLHAGVRHTTVPGVRHQCTLSILLVQSHGQRSVNRHLIAFYRCNGSVPIKVYVAGFPSQRTNASAKNLTSQRSNPLFCARTVDHHTVTDLQPCARCDIEGQGIHRYIIGNNVCSPRLLAVIYTFYINKGATVHTVLLQNSFFLRNAAQHYSRSFDTQGFRQIKRPLVKQHGPPKAICIRLQRSYIVQRTLNALTVVTLSMGNKDYTFDGRNVHIGIPITTCGIVQQAIATGIFHIRQMLTVRTNSKGLCIDMHKPRHQQS